MIGGKTVKTLIDHITHLALARQEAEAFLQAVNLSVLDLDTGGFLLPGKVDAEALTLTWMIGPQKALEGGGVISFDLGLKLWLPDKESGPSASILVNVHGPEREASWREVKRLSTEHGWRVMVGVEGWEENQIEAAREPLTTATDPQEIAQAAFDSAFGIRR